MQRVQQSDSVGEKKVNFGNCIDKKGPQIKEVPKQKRRKFSISHNSLSIVGEVIIEILNIYLLSIRITILGSGYPLIVVYVFELPASIISGLSANMLPHFFFPIVKIKSNNVSRKFSKRGQNLNILSGG
ncbi:hypothetical protein CIPAW_10G033600 [Carya illinoinensis]|uniref:Uncharacterized protein n=1 Tax=Carya illinoinensis TaxID=32201 RepID=A0A8T1P9P1_CARIL|nr:hypothetical protein CIPAW_10G033600 [Carya illinoinensis]